MMKRLTIILVLTAVFVGFAQASPNYSEDFKLEIGEQAELGDYEFRFHEDDNGEGIFQTGIVQDNGGVLINRQLVGDEIQDAEGERTILDNNLNYTIEESYRGIEGRYLILEVNSSEDVFASADLTTDSPQRVLVDQGGAV
jgi:lipocalin